MFQLQNERTAGTAVKTANLSRKFARIGSVFAMLVIVLCLFNACEKDENAPDSLAGTTWAMYENGKVIVTFEFKSGGKGVYTDFDDHKVKNFTYTYKSPNVTINIDDEEPWIFVVNGNKMSEIGDDHVFIKQ